MTTEKMNTENMTIFLAQVSEAHKEDFIVMVLDGASSHRSKDLVIPDNVALIRLPPYSPELNPAEQIWNILRRNYFANRVFDSLDAATAQAEPTRIDTTPSTADLSCREDFVGVVSILCSRSPA
jgi:transposase